MGLTTLGASMLRMRVVLGALLLVVTAAGCSSAPPDPFPNRKPVHPVKGQVFFNDKPAQGAFVVFVPMNEPAGSKDPRPHAEVGEGGTFELATYSSADGAPVGEYIVTMWWPGGVAPDNTEEPSDKLLGKYNDASNSPLRATVKEGPNELPPIKLK